MNDVFEVLINFFTKIENGFFSKQQQDSFLSELAHLGVALDKLQEALNNEKALNTRIEDQLLHTPKGLRVYTESECLRLTKKCRGFLLLLEQQGILTPSLREMVIAQLLRLPQDTLTPQQIKWITLHVLFTQRKQISVISMERFLLHETPEQKH